MTSVAYRFINKHAGRCFNYWKGSMDMMPAFVDVDELRSFLYGVICNPKQSITIMRKLYENDVDVVKCTLIVNDNDENDEEFTTTNNFPEHSEICVILKVVNILYKRKFRNEELDKDGK